VIGEKGDNADEIERTVQIKNQKGLHARASAKFVRCAQSFDAEVSVSRDGLTVGGSSIMGLMMLAASPGSSIHIKCTGKEAAAVMEALNKLIDAKFEEDQ
jgi:phosphocarrier protein